MLDPMMNPQPGGDLLSRLYPGQFGRPTAKTGSGYALGTSGATAPPQGGALLPVPGVPATGRGAVAGNPYQLNGASGSPVPAPATQQPGEYDWLTQGHSDQPAGGMFGKAGFHQIRSPGTKVVDSQYGQLANEWAHEAPIDYSGGAEIGQYYNAARDRQAAMDAAMGRSGGGVGAAGQASLYGQQGSAVASMIRQLLQEKERRHAAELSQLRGFGQQVSLAELERGWQKQDKPGFGKQLLGVLGDVAGNLIPSFIPHGGNKDVNSDPMGLGGGYAQTPDPLDEYLRQLSEPSTFAGIA